MDLCLLILSACISSPSSKPQIYTPSFYPANPTPTILWEVLPHQQPSQLDLEQLWTLARSITVKVYSGTNQGSGVLIQRQGQIYTVLTNKHVLNAGNPYRVETPDGQVYFANLSSSIRFGEKDLALLQFRSPQTTYTVASVSRFTAMQVGDEIFAAGFPFAVEPSLLMENFVFTTGQISLVLEQALVGGYQVGYTNEIQKGMSGGPILNRKGELVGINGMHKYPLWGDPYIFEDGSKPDRFLRTIMVHSSLGIPSKMFAQLTTPLSQKAAGNPFLSLDGRDSRPPLSH